MRLAIVHYVRLRPLLGSVLAGLSLVSGSAMACEHYTAYPDVVLDTVYAAAPVRSTRPSVTEYSTSSAIPRWCSRGVA